MKTYQTPTVKWKRFTELDVLTGSNEDGKVEVEITDIWE